MSAGRLPQLAHSEPPGQNWRQKLEFWCEQLRECARKPSRRRVHGLRAATLRLQAELDETLQHSTTAPAAVRAAQRWHRKARRVRKLLAPVRDADVCLALLATFHDPDARAGRAESPEARDSRRAMKLLSRSLHRKREAARKRMILTLETRQDRIEAAAREVGQRLVGAEPPHVDHSNALEAIVSELTAAAQRLTPDALHAFRKLAKTGRYLAEHCPQTDTRAQEVAVQCRAVQTAVGRWRDWSLLTERASQLISRREGRVLAHELDATSERLLNEALKQCLRSAAALSDEAKYELTRRPVRSVRAVSIRRFA
jgi:CHAD domain-containing protein